MQTEEQEQLQDPAVVSTGGINIGGQTVINATAHLPEKQKQLIRWLHDYCRRLKWKWADAAAQTGLSRNLLYKVWTDAYRYDKKHAKAGQRIPLDSTCRKIAEFRKQHAQDYLELNPDFVETRVFTRIENLCKRAYRRKQMGFIYGSSQVGKTTALKEYARRNNGGQTVYVEMPPSSGVQLMCKEIARGLHVSPNTSYDKLVYNIRAALDGSRQLLIDEIHRVFTTYQKTSVMRCLDVFRWLFDQTGCSIILCGTDVFRDQIQAGEFFQYLQQLKRRGASYELQLPTAPPLEDLYDLAAAFGLREPTGDAAQVVKHIANQDGFGVFKMRLLDAKDLADKKKERLAWTHFTRAYQITERQRKGN